METDAYLLPIVTHGAQVPFFYMWGLKNDFLHEPDLRVRLSIFPHLRLPLRRPDMPLLLLYEPPSTNPLVCWKLHPYGGGCNPLDQFHTPLDLVELRR